MNKIHGMEDYLLNKIIKYYGIGCFIEDYIEQSHQFGIIDEKRETNLSDRVKASIVHSKMKIILLNG